MLNIAETLKGLQGALDAVKKLAPAASVLGVPAAVVAVAEIASAAVTVATNVVDRIEDGKVVVSNTDAAAVRSILADLQAENDKLAAVIARS